MNDEIKEKQLNEVLYGLDYIGNKIKNDDGKLELGVNNCKLLLDYITKLQQAFEKSYTEEQLDFAVNEVKEQLKIEKQYSNQLCNEIDELRIENYTLNERWQKFKEYYEDYKYRCEKASEYITSEEYYDLNNKKTGSFSEDSKNYFIAHDKLLNILQNGSDS